MGAAVSKTQETHILEKQACRSSLAHTPSPEIEAKLEIEAELSWIH